MPADSTGSAGPADGTPPVSVAEPPAAPDGPATLTRRGSVTLRAAFAVSSAGDWIYKFAVPTLILRLTGSPVATAFAYILEFLPYVLIGPFAGVLADRFPRRRTMVGCDAGSCALALILAGLVYLGHPPVAALYVCALALACTRPLYFPAFQGFLVEMVPEAGRPRFNSWTQVTDGLLSLGGPVIGTVVVAAAGVSLATVLDAASFALSASLVATIACRRPAARPAAGPAPRAGLAAGVLADLRDGFRAIAASRAILAGLILITLANLTSFSIEGNLVYLVLHAEHQAKIALGVVFTAQGAGAIIGAAAAPRLLARTRTGVLLAAGLATSAVAMLIPTVSPHFPAVVAGQAVEGCASALVVVCWFSAVQSLIPERLIGRFVSAARAVGYLAIPAGALLGAWLLSASPATRTLFACAAALQVLIVLVTTRSPLLRIDAGSAGEPATPA